MATTKYGNYISSKDSGGNTCYIRPFITYTIKSDDDYTYITFHTGLNNTKNSRLSLTAGGGVYNTASGTGHTSVKVQKDFVITEGGANSITYVTSRTWKWARSESGEQTKTVSSKVSFPSASHFYNQTSTISVTVKVPQKSATIYTVEYDANGGEDAPDPQEKQKDVNLTLSSVKPTKDSDSSYTYTFKEWNTKSDGTGTTYQSGGTYTANEKATLYAQYTKTAITPTPSPTYTAPTFTIESVSETAGHDDYIVDVSSVTVVLSDINWGGSSCAADGIVLTVSDGTHTLTETATSSGTSCTLTTDEFTSEGVYSVKVSLTSNASYTTVKEYGSIIVDEQVWEIVTGTGEHDFKVQQPIPTEYTRGTSAVVVEAWNYEDSSYDTVDGSWTVRVLAEPTGQNPIWTIDGIYLPADYINNGSYKIRVSFVIYTSTQTEGRQAFFSTTKNALFTSGLANNVFVAGCTMTNYSSRAWYSYPNDPLYFPDTNYVEVGANDTAIMGMIKCGEYLAVVKQAKPTDTSIYMLYPTSYDDNTTYAIRQSISGNGSQSRFSFNVLNDEALFLSPEGVTAIVLSEDNQHKLQNRSYYINKPLLKENLENAYSFIYNGMYLLSVPKEDDDNGNKMGKIFVLDGNQMTSWETSKTNLQYEGYVWEGVTAWCLMRYDNELWFSDKGNVYRFKTEDDYDAETGENNKYKDDGSPVKATWSTIFDNDGATNYYKSLQKRGNVVTLNGSDLTSARVYFQKDENERILIKDIETKFTYKRAYPSSTEFNAHKEWYFVYDGKNYIKCIGKTYDSSEEYYMLDFENISGYPIDIFTKKKMKKYKRLQISIENNRAESFGVREIVKTYTIGNYAKK